MRWRGPGSCRPRWTCPRPSPGTTAPASALLQFARVPWAMPQADAWLLGDLRYDREPELGIAEIEIGPSTDDCPAYRPPWVPPRQDLLQGR
jgi:inner membrane protein